MNRRDNGNRPRSRAARKPETKNPRTHYNAALAAAPPRVVAGALRTDLSLPAVSSALLIALGHLAAVVAGRSLALEPQGAAALWPASGILLAALILNERRQWPLILGLVFLAHTAASPILGGQVPGLGPAFALAACIQAYVAARLLAHYFRMPLALAGLRDVLGLAAAAAGGSALGGLIEAGLMVAAGQAASLRAAWAAWALADGLGVLIVAPAILSWAGSPGEAANGAGWRRAVEPALALAALGAAAGLIFGAPPDAPGAHNLPILAFPILLWAAMRLGRPGATAGVALLGGAAAWFTVHGRGPFAAAGPAGGASLLWLQVYLGVTALCTLGLAVAVARRKRAALDLQQAHARLSAWARQLEQRNRQVATLNRMGDLFQSCMTAEDAYHVIALIGPQLFPGKSGALYLLSPDREQTRPAAHWGPVRLPDAGFGRDECLALRRGRMYWVGAGRPGRPCHHVPPAQGAAFVCVPLMALGEVMGVLHLRAVGPQADDDLDEAALELARAAADSMALALGYVRLRQTLREQSIRDPLTGLFNRRYMQETLDRELSRARRGDYPVGLIMLDLDGFKGFNDAFGHEAGDAALRALGDYLRQQVRGEDVACRYGGEEFTLILPNATLPVTQERAEQLREGARGLRLQHRGRALGSLTLSFGLAAFPQHGATGAEVLRAADEALYRAKAQGRNRVAVAPPR